MQERIASRFPAMRTSRVSSSPRPFSVGSMPQTRQGRLAARASNQKIDEALDRRSALLAGSAAVVAPFLLPRQARARELPPGKIELPVKNLNSFQRKDERAGFTVLVETELKAELTRPEDAPDTLRLVLHDAGTYDVATGTGGLNGSIRFSEELDRPENSDLKPIADRLKKVKSRIEEKTKDTYGPISWADLEVLAVKVANEAQWRKIKKARGVPSAGDTISSAFGASWTVKLGRLDTDKPDPAGRLPKPDASVQEITDTSWGISGLQHISVQDWDGNAMSEFFGRLGNKDYGATGFFAPKPIFDQRQAFVLYGSSQTQVSEAESKLAADPKTSYKDFQTKYNRSRDTVTRTDYEVDLIDYFNLLIGLGAKFDPDAYLIPILIDTPKF